ncbi:translation initiation factor IF-2-like [Talpa occidentalis]|uniref:translation initiation factor IF-2-like n=1 Tax=Talpa occidentalis TaxID=50954 RepID=UPI00188EC2A3|nr:translation initiation factor IF-2-like [Talpa occidentalis]
MPLSLERRAPPFPRPPSPSPAPPQPRLQGFWTPRPRCLRPPAPGGAGAASLSAAESGGAAARASCSRRLRRSLSSGPAGQKRETRVGALCPGSSGFVGSWWSGGARRTARARPGRGVCAEKRLPGSPRVARGPSTDGRRPLAGRGRPRRRTDGDTSAAAAAAQTESTSGAGAPSKSRPGRSLSQGSGSLWQKLHSRGAASLRTRGTRSCWITANEQRPMLTKLRVTRSSDAAPLTEVDLTVGISLVSIACCPAGEHGGCCLLMLLVTGAGASEAASRKRVWERMCVCVSVGKSCGGW